MQVNRYSLSEGARAARGLTVVVDVFRAFTCTPLLFSLGAADCMLVATPEEALQLKKRDPSLILTGEVSGIPIQGFDLGNSPSQILRQKPDFFRDKRVVQRTSSGVQGALIALDKADEVLLGSYTLAKTTAEHILSKTPDRVSIVAMGWELQEIAPEDECCARYLEHLLGQGNYDHHEALREILFHESAQKFLRGDKPYFPPEDPVLCLQRDLYDFVLKAHREGDMVVVGKIPLSRKDERGGPLTTLFL
jgi:2-phosphosulfolactate phosphatase